MSIIAQDMLQVAPYYLLDSNSSVADILFFDPRSAEVAYGTGAQGEFKSNITDNSALMTLVVHYLNTQLGSVKTCVALRPYDSFAILVMTCLRRTKGQPILAVP